MHTSNLSTGEGRAECFHWIHEARDLIEAYSVAAAALAPKPAGDGAGLGSPHTDSGTAAHQGAGAASASTAAPRPPQPPPGLAGARRSGAGRMASSVVMLPDLQRVVAAVTGGGAMWRLRRRYSRLRLAIAQRLPRCEEAGLHTEAAREQAAWCIEHMGLLREHEEGHEEEKREHRPFARRTHAPKKARPRPNPHPSQPSPSPSPSP